MTDILRLRDGPFVHECQEDVRAAHNPIIFHEVPTGEGLYHRD